MSRLLGSEPGDATQAEPPLGERVATDLANRGWSVQAGFLSAAEAAALREEARALLQRGAFQDVGVARSPTHAGAPALGGERVCWIDAAAASRRQREVLQRMEELRASLNRRMFLGLLGFEAHFSLSPPGTGYVQPIDRFARGGTRIVSTTLFLDDAWSPGDGGALRLDLEGGAPVDVLPTAGTLVVFLSERIPHEVLPAERERWSLTGWFLRRA